MSVLYSVSVLTKLKFSKGLIINVVQLGDKIGLKYIDISVNDFELLSIDNKTIYEKIMEFDEIKAIETLQGNLYFTIFFFNINSFFEVYLSSNNSNFKKYFIEGCYTFDFAKLSSFLFDLVPHFPISKFECFRDDWLPEQGIDKLTIEEPFFYVYGPNIHKYSENEEPSNLELILNQIKINSYKNNIEFWDSDFKIKYNSENVIKQVRKDIINLRLSTIWIKKDSYKLKVIFSIRENEKYKHGITFGPLEPFVNKKFDKINSIDAHSYIKIGLDFLNEIKILYSRADNF